MKLRVQLQQKKKRSSVSLIHAPEVIIGEEKMAVYKRKYKRTKLFGSDKKHDRKLAMNDDKKERTDKLERGLTNLN
jgi:late competence protein required for DNA uptake (superfamily II DNA/RNA helicase)